LTAAPRPFVGLLAGVAAGLVAAAALDVLRATAPKQIGDAGAESPDKAPSPFAPYIVGATIGGIYGVLAEYSATASAGFGRAYGLAASALLDETVSEETQAGPGAPLEAASPPLFAAVLEGVRTLLAGKR
jgi:hypothetical protein